MCVLCRSTGKVANLTITATLSNCILHRQGKVTVEGCKLQCYAGGLEHLFTPLVTLAAAGLSKHKQAMPVLTGREAGMGVLSVVETKIRVSPPALHVLHCCCVNGDAGICVIQVAVLVHFAFLLLGFGSTGCIAYLSIYHL